MDGKPVISERERLLNAQNCINMRMRRVGRALSDFYNAVMEPSGLHGNQFLLLVPIYFRPGITINQLAKRVDLDRTTLARNLKLLEDREVITLSPGKDQRTRTIELTEKGRQKLMEALPLWEKAQQQIVDYLGQEQVARLYCCLDQLEALFSEPRSR
jgi:DNA-binding MarR family transcriptional regulator